MPTGGVMRIEVSLPPLASQAAAVSSGLAAWQAPVSGSESLMLLLDNGGIVVACSQPLARAFGYTTPADVLGRGFSEDFGQFVDTSRWADPVSAADLLTTAPLITLTTGALSRSYLRARVGEKVCSFDVVAAPIADEEGDGLIAVLQLVTDPHDS